ncbi:5513_t:CDS:2 [Entrophospora sp. SA101]|nr:5513_t:CDS:2 [Entrophospora sp. SA101]
MSKSIDEASKNQKIAVDEITSQFELPVEKLREIVSHFCDEMNKGLENNGMTVAMIPSFVTGSLTGKEAGTSLALDLGGTNLRICQIDFKKEGKHRIKQQKYKISEDLKRSEAHKLFEFIADCVDKFLSEEFDSDLSMGEKLKLGFTFSFPVEQTAINKGKLIHWTKGFDCPGAAGKDVVFMLQESLNFKGVPVEVVALINDTVGTLLAHSYEHPNTLLGVIFGTGTNGAFLEKISNIKKLKNFTDTEEKMIVNIEWGAFDNERKVLPLTMFDNKLDRKSINPREQIFEKMISGMYLGQITQNILLNLIDRGLLFGGFSSQIFNKHYSFETAYMSTIEDDKSPNLENTRKVLEELLNIPSTTLTDRQIVKKICHLVGLRAARLSAAALAGVITHCDVIECGCDIGIDGSLFESYPNFKAHIYAALGELFGSNSEKIVINVARDGSGVGAEMLVIMNEMMSHEGLGTYGIGVNNSNKLHDRDILELLMAADELIFEELINPIQDYLLQHNLKWIQENVLSISDRAIDSIIITHQHAALIASWIDGKIVTEEQIPREGKVLSEAKLSRVRKDCVGDAIQLHEKLGPSFGFYELKIIDDAHECGSSYASGGLRYENKIRDKGNYFGVDDYEVFQVLKK